MYNRKFTMLETLDGCGFGGGLIFVPCRTLCGGCFGGVTFILLDFYLFFDVMYIDFINMRC